MKVEIVASGSFLKKAGGLGVVEHRGRPCERPDRRTAKKSIWETVCGYDSAALVGKGA